MSPNFERDYDEVVAYIEGYRSFLSRVARPSYATLWRERPRVARALRQTLDRPFLSARVPEEVRGLVGRFASDSDKAGPYFTVVMSEYSIDALSSKSLEKFPHVDWGAMIKLHERNAKKLSTWSPKSVFGAVVSVLAVLLKTVPKSVVERDLGMDYAQFERFVFLAMLICLGYLVPLLLQKWYRQWKAKPGYDLVAEVLSYTALKAEQTQPVR